MALAPPFTKPVVDPYMISDLTINLTNV
jgi:hypothetical protein